MREVTGGNFRRPWSCLPVRHATQTTQAITLLLPFRTTQSPLNRPSQWLGTSIVFLSSCAPPRSCRSGWCKIADQLEQPQLSRSSPPQQRAPVAAHAPDPRRSPSVAEGPSRQVHALPLLRSARLDLGCHHVHDGQNGSRSSTLPHPLRPGRHISNTTCRATRLGSPATRSSPTVYYRNRAPLRQVQNTHIQSSFYPPICLSLCHYRLACYTLSRARCFFPRVQTALPSMPLLVSDGQS
jgi:hypothetical protein